MAPGRFCERCGAGTDADARFCTRCGGVLTGESAEGEASGGARPLPPLTVTAPHVSRAKPPPDWVPRPTEPNLSSPAEPNVSPLPDPTITLPAEPAVSLRSAALLWGDRRVVIPSGGLTLGAGAECDLRVPGEVAEVHAVVQPTETGHVIVEQSQSAIICVNGESLAMGERRPLERGDSISIAEQVMHYLPGGLPRLAPITPVDVGHVCTSKQEFILGRDQHCDLVLDHPTVSRRHGAIYLQAEQATIEDLQSATGVRVNGQPIHRRAALEVGDQIAVGPYRIVFDGQDLFERVASPGLNVVAIGVRVDVPSGTILQPTSLHLRAGELVAIVGQSGAGKSTLLKALAGVCPPTSGRILLGGEDVGERQGELGYVPQFDIVHERLTVREALDYAAQLRLPPDTQPSERSHRIEKVLEQLGLEDRADLRVASLSGGQRKRVAVGIELLHRPGILFLDEPTTGLDPALERRLMELFRTLADAGQTVILVTHATGSMSLCDRVIAMGAGGILRFDGTPDELLERFRVTQFDELYTQIEHDTESIADPDHHPGILPRLPTLGASRHPGVVRRQRPTLPIHQKLKYQTKVLSRRYATLMIRDRRHIRSALIQVPILGVLTAMMFNSAVFAHDPTKYAGKSAQLLFLMVTIAAWLGSINAAREIVKERHVLARELAVGVHVRAYLTSKLVVLLAMVSAQTCLFALIVLTLRPLHEPSAVSFELVCVLLITGWVAVLLGLLVSAYAASEDQATGVIPLLLVPQLLFGGAIVTIKNLAAPMKLLSALVPARWSFAAAGDAIHLNARIASDPVFSTMSQYGSSFFSLHFLVFMLIGAAFAGGLFWALERLLRTPWVWQ